MPGRMPKKRGRPAEYNRDKALEDATRLFWDAGFAATSLDALSDATGLTRPSLAGAFGDKEALYLEALGRYRDAGLEAMTKTLGGDRPLRTELADLFSKSTAAYMGPDGAARGCLLVGTATVEAVHRPAVREALQASLVAFNAIIEERMRKAIEQGELGADADAAGLASLVSAVMHSLAVRARAGDARRALDRLSRTAVDMICGGPPKHRA